MVFVLCGVCVCVSFSSAVSAFVIDPWQHYRFITKQIDAVVLRKSTWIVSEERETYRDIVHCMQFLVLRLLANDS